MRLGMSVSGLVLLVVGLAANPLVGKVVEVTADGEGMSASEAKNDALRKALEQGAGVEIASHSQVEDFVLIRDAIYARSEGIVTEYRILDEGKGAGGVYYCKVKANVDTDAVASTWGAVQNLLDQLGQPRIVVYIEEVIDNQAQDSSILEHKLENMLLKAGFAVYAGQQVRAILDKETGDAAAEANTAKINKLAKDFGAQIYITGYTHANNAGRNTVFGESFMNYNGDAAFKMYRTDTGELIASESVASWRGSARGYREFSPQAGKKALENLAEQMGPQLYESILRKWTTELSAGGEISLEIEGVNFADAVKIKQMLEAMDKVERVGGPDLTKGIATYRIVAKMTGYDLGTRMVGEEWQKLIEVQDVKQTRIQAKATKKD